MVGGCGRGTARPLRYAVTMMVAAGSLLLGTAVFGASHRQDDGRGAAGGSLPEIKKDCSTCHLPAGAGGPKELKLPLSLLCLYCHRDRMSQGEHKIDVKPAVKVEGLPLTGGRMTCATCHDVHTNARGKLLRMPARDLCQACHPR